MSGHLAWPRRRRSRPPLEFADDLVGLRATAGPRDRTAESLWTRTAQIATSILMSGSKKSNRSGAARFATSLTGSPPSREKISSSASAAAGACLRSSSSKCPRFDTPTTVTCVFETEATLACQLMESAFSWSRATGRTSAETRNAAGGPQRGRPPPRARRVAPSSPTGAARRPLVTARRALPMRPRRAVPS